MKDNSKELRMWLLRLVKATEQAVDDIDREMEDPSTKDRGKRIAAITNALELEKDQAKRYGLGIGLKKTDSIA